jgi:hypothetical protein
LTHGGYEKEWYRDGELHRLDGPAYERWKDGKLIWSGWWDSGRPMLEGRIEALKLKKAKRDTHVRRAMSKLKAVHNISSSASSDLPGSMVWAETQGRFIRDGFKNPFMPRSSCLEATYVAPDGSVNTYTRDHLYFIAKGMGLPATRRMNKDELCDLMNYRSPRSSQAPY